MPPEHRVPIRHAVAPTDISDYIHELSLPTGLLSAGARAALAELLVFTPMLEPPATGLDTFAAASLPSPNGPGAMVPSLASLAQPGPFNPAASLSTKVTKKILDLEFVEMAEIYADATAKQVLGRCPGRPPVVGIHRQWVERFSLMTAVIATRFPHKAPELFAYQATIVRAERNYEVERWVAYERQFRR